MKQRIVLLCMFSNLLLHTQRTSSDETVDVTIKFNTESLSKTLKDIRATVKPDWNIPAPSIVTAVTGVAGVKLTYLGLESLIRDMKTRDQPNKATNWQLGVDAGQIVVGALITGASLYIWHRYLRSPEESPASITKGPISDGLSSPTRTSQLLSSSSSSSI